MLQETIKYGSLAADSGVFIYKEKRPERTTHAMDEIHAWYESAVYSYIFNRIDYYDYKARYYSPVPLEQQPVSLLS